MNKSHYYNKDKGDGKIMDRSLLIRKAFEAMEFSYSPYSNFQVGAALLTKSGKIYTGCNIESVAFTPTVCGERTAIFKAVSEGEREFEALVAVGGPKDKDWDELGWSGPCGVCRQVINEFCKGDLKIIIAKSEEVYKEFTLEELLPYGFGPEHIG
ncbi:cytidine deaminase [Neobacillus sp. NPDC093127]|uniref:cytidine deaminase n=1 Tax=Neobacillus sp. NPDC093127 TaxID=3364296 RepID=UPI003827A6F3